MRRVQSSISDLKVGIARVSVFLLAAFSFTLTCVGQAGSIPAEGTTRDLSNPNAASDFQRALEFQKQGRLDDALKQYHSLLVLAPGHLPSLFNMGLVLDALDRHEEALESFTKVSSIDPHYPHTQLFLGIENIKLHRPGSAVTLLGELAATSDSRDDQVWFWLARAEAETGKPSQALSAARRAMSIKDSPSAEFLVVKLLSDSGNWADAEAELRKMIERYGDLPGTHELLGDIYYHEARPEDAISEFRLELKTRPDSLESNSMMGIVLSERGNYSDAVPYLFSAIRIDPRQPEVHTALALALWKLSMPKDALVQAKHAEELDSRPVQVHFLLWKIYADLKDAEASQKEFVIYRSLLSK